jgi:serine O-acetyltransferase
LGTFQGRRAATFHHKKNGKPMVRSTRVSKTNGSTGKRDLVEYVDKQLCALFPDRNKPRMALKRNIDEAMDRTLYSLSHVRLLSHQHFNHLHSDVYAQFLYFLSNTIWTNDEDSIAASKLFYLNKALHGINCMYTTQLPDVFLLVHCVGSVLGNAVYSNFFVCCQNVTVGTDRQKQPHISEGVYMGPGSSIIGDSHVGPLTILSVNATIINQTTTGNSVVISNNSALITKPLRRNIIYDLYFHKQQGEVREITPS